MAEQNTPGDKKLSVQSKTLTLKPRVETGTVRQSFPHGRTKQVVVEKRGKRRLGGEGPATQTARAPEAAPHPAGGRLEMRGWGGGVGHRGAYARRSTRPGPAAGCEI